MLTWNCLLTGGYYVAIWWDISIDTVITTSNPRTDMIQWHLLNKWGAIFAKVPPLKYLKLITSHVHAELYNMFGWKTAGHHGTKWITSQSIPHRQVKRHLKWFRDGSTSGLSQCILFIMLYFQSLTSPIPIITRTHARLGRSTQHSDICVYLSPCQFSSLEMTTI
jgi:hypothetical protein